MDIPTQVNIALCILSFVLAAISVITVVATLLQNNKMIENSTRPYVTIYFDYAQMGTPTGFFVVKNFGATSALILSLSYNEPIKSHPTVLSDLPAMFDGLLGNFVAPGQKFLIPFRLHEYSGEPAVFDITYKAGKKVYSEHLEINVVNYGKFVKPRIKDDANKSISYPLHEIAERLM